MRKLVLVVGLALVGACSKGQEAETQPAPPPTPKPEVAKPPPPPMTEAEIAAVVDSAREAKDVLEAAEAAGKKLPKGRDGLIPWETLIPYWNDTVLQVDKVFDTEGAERLTRERPDHPDAAGVRRALHRVELTRLKRDFIVAQGEWRQAADRLEARNKEARVPDFWTRLERLDRASIKLNRDTQTRLNMLQISIQPDEKGNLKRTQGLQYLLRKNINDRELELRLIAQRVEAEKFVVQGGIEVTAKQMWKDFDANEIAALQKYKGKQVRLSGKVARVSADMMDKPQIHLRTPNSFEHVLVHGAPTGQAAKLRRGDEITVICVRISEVLGSPVCDTQ